MFFSTKAYFVFVFSTVFVVVLVSILSSFFASVGAAAGAAALALSAGFAAAAVIVSAGAAGGGVVVVVVVLVDVESLFAASPLPLPQDATKRPIDRANTLIFTNFIISILDGYEGLYPK